MDPTTILVAALEPVGTTVRAVGSLAAAAFLYALSRIVHARHVGSWAAGFGALAVAHACLALSRRLPALGRPLEAAYFLGEWLFVLLLVAGLAGRERALPSAWSRGVVIPVTGAVALAAVLSGLDPSFAQRFVPHAAFMAAGLAVALFVTVRMQRRERATTGRLLVSLALGLLALHFLHFIPILARASATRSAPPVAWSVLVPLADLVLEAALALSLALLAAEDLRRGFDEVDRALRGARDRLTVVAGAAPFAAALDRPGDAGSGGALPPRGGSVVALEVADLEARKARLGALAGDAAVRALARAIRSVVRADDLVYRWSGGEFLVVLPGVAPDEAQRRFARFDGALRGAGAADAGLELVASWGVAPYTPDQPMAAAVEAAVAAASVKRTASQEESAPEAPPPPDSAGD